MKTSHSFGIDFIVRKQKNENAQGLLYARITVDGKVTEASLKESIDLKMWDKRNERVIGRTIYAKTVNDLIESTRTKLKDTYRSILQEGSELSAQAIKDRFLGGKKKITRYTLSELTIYFMRIFESKMKQGGYKNYKTTVDYIDRFIKSTTKTNCIMLEDVNNKVITDYEYYVRNNPIKNSDPCLGNGVGKHIQRFKRIISWSVEIGWLPNNPIANYRCIIKKHKRQRLSFQELYILENKLFGNTSLNYAKDLFLFGCYTSFAYVDVITLSEKDLLVDGERVWCFKYRVKSDELQPVLLLSTAIRILAKYRGTSKDPERIFPTITNQALNRSLRIIQEACEITTPMTFHVARHTFAKTVALKNGINLETLRMIMGHTKITTTQIYADVDEEIISNQMENLEKMLEIKREEIRNLQSETANNEISPL